MEYSAECDIPADAHYVTAGFVLNGRGKMWLDDVRIEVVSKLASQKQN
jgi:hypothetical protein